MKHMIIYALFLLAVCLYAGRIEISLSPFKIVLHDWHKTIGLFLVIAGFAIYDVIENRKNYKQGFRAGIEYITNNFKDESRKDIQEQK